MKVLEMITKILSIFTLKIQVFYEIWFLYCQFAYIYLEFI
jgi:hypothetical protein